MRFRFLFALSLIAALLLAACGTTPTAAPTAAPAAPTAAAEQPTAMPAPTAMAEPTAAPAPTAGGQPTAVASSGGSGTVKIGILAPITGPAASIGQEQLNFGKLAVEDFNKANGTTYELVEGDTQLDPAKATDAAQRFAADNDIYVIVGPAGSQEVLAVAPVLGKVNLPMISPSATRTDLTEQGFKNFFRVVPRDDVQGATDANFMIDQLKAKKVWVIDDQTAYSTGLRDVVVQVLKDKGVAATTESITQKDTDFSALVTKMKGDAPDAVFLPWQLANQAAVFAKQMAEQGVKATIFGSDGLFSAKDFIDGAAGATEGAYVSNFAPDIKSIAASKPVADAYQAKYGDFTSFGAPTYAAMMVALEAVQRAEKSGTLSRDTVLAELGKTDQSSSVLGIPIKLNAKGDVENASFFLFQVKDGKFVLVTKSS
jgi:branched-chain amino acid transport system substrate-binding protein